MTCKSGCKHTCPNRRAGSRNVHALTRHPPVSQLTGGQYKNVYLGSFGSDTITLPSVISGRPPTFKGIFACYDVGYYCDNNDMTCINNSISCPAENIPSLKQGGVCPKLLLGDGLEAGESRLRALMSLSC